MRECKKNEIQIPSGVRENNTFLKGTRKKGTIIIFNSMLIHRIRPVKLGVRYSLLTCILAGLGRSLSEVGAIIIVGGNIAHVTREMTTTMLLETTKGNLEIAIALGFVLIFISILINLLVFVLKEFAQRYSYD